MIHTAIETLITGFDFDEFSCAANWLNHYSCFPFDDKF